MSGKNKRTEVDMDDLEFVTGGMLSVDTVDGVKVVKKYNAEHECVGTWEILTTKTDVFTTMQKEYWELGDNGMIDKLIADGKIKPQ